MQSNRKLFWPPLFLASLAPLACRANSSSTYATCFIGCVGLSGCSCRDALMRKLGCTYITR